MVEREKFDHIEERLRAIEGGGDFAFADMAELGKLSSPGQARLLQVKATTRLGKLLINLLPSFPINRCEGAEGRGSDFQTLKDLVKLRRRRRKKKKKQGRGAFESHP